MVQSFNRKTYRPTTIYTTGVPVCVLNRCLFNHAYCVCFVVPSVLPERFYHLYYTNSFPFINAKERSSFK